MGRRLRGPMNIYWYYERTVGRMLGAAGLLLALPGIPVATAHGVPGGAAGVVGALLAVALLALTVTWRRRWSLPALAAVVVLLFWPAPVWAPWAFFAGLYAFVVVLAEGVWYRMRDRYLRLENQWRHEDGKPPYVMSQEAIAEAYRAARG